MMITRKTPGAKTRLLVLLAAIATSVAALYGQTQDIDFAARTNNVKLAQQLIDQKIDVNQKDDRGYTPLILATYNQSPQVAELLLLHGADPEVRDSTGRTALMGASFQGDTKCVGLLLDHGAQVDGTDVNGATALMYAVQFGRTEAVKLLIARKADPSLKDKRGFDAFYLAQQLEDPEILQILQHRLHADSATEKPSPLQTETAYLDSTAWDGSTYKTCQAKRALQCRSPDSQVNFSCEVTMVRFPPESNRVAL